MFVAIGLLLIIVIGYFLQDMVTPDLALGEKVSLSFGMGMGFTALLMFLLLYCKLLNSKTQLLMVMVFIALLLFARRRMIKPTGVVQQLRQITSLHESNFFTWWNYTLYFTIFTLFIFSFVFAYYYPIIITDGTDYEVTGKLMTMNRAIEPENYFRPYPPLIPVSYTFIYFLGGLHPKIMFPLFYLSLVFCFYFRLIALGINKKSSSIFTLVLATTPYLWWHSFLGILNLTAAYYFSVATLFWFSHLRNISDSENKSRINYSYPLLAGIFYSLSITTRFEMLTYFLIPLIFTVFYSLKYHLLKNLLCLVIPSLFVSSYWALFSIYQLGYDEHFALFPIAIIFLVIAVVLFYFIVLNRGFGNIMNFIDKCEMRISSFLKIVGVGFAVLLVVYTFLPHDIENNLHFVNKAVFFVKTVVTKSITVLFANVFFLTTSVLLTLLPGRIMRYEDGGREHKYLFVFIISFLIVNVVIFSCLFFTSYPEKFAGVNWSYDLREFLNTIVYHPGQIINNTQIRGLLPLYPIIIFYCALSKKIQKALGE